MSARNSNIDRGRAYLSSVAGFCEGICCFTAERARGDGWTYLNHVGQELAAESGASPSIHDGMPLDRQG